MKICINQLNNYELNWKRKICSVNIHAAVLLTQYCVGGKIEKKEMGGACAACGGGERCAQGSGGET